MGVSNGDGDGGGVDGDGSGGNSPSRQSARTELLSPEIRWRWWRRGGTFRGSRLMILGFTLRRDVIGGRATPGGGRGTHTLPGRDQGWTRAQGWCGHPGAPLRLCFGLRGRVGKNRNFGFRIVQFREYFLCNFSETQKQQKTGNWHCGNLLIG